MCDFGVVVLAVWLLVEDEQRPGGEGSTPPTRNAGAQNNKPTQNDNEHTAAADTGGAGAAPAAGLCAAPGGGTHARKHLILCRTHKGGRRDDASIL